MVSMFHNLFFYAVKIPLFLREELPHQGMSLYGSCGSSGQTINSFFKIPIRTKFIELKGDSLRAFQDKLDKVEYLILEEMSTIDQGLFGKIDSRLRQAFPHRADQVLGGCSVILLGDFAQIPPVAGTPLYSGILTDNTWLTAGRLAYGAFNNAVILQKV